jgi:hypothetical protein
MKATKMPTKKFVAYIDKRIKKHLIEHRIYDIDTYAWLDAETVNPKHLGYAAWVLTPKVEFEFEAFFNQQSLSKRPSNSDIEMMTAGRDFIETMKGAYYMIGQTLFFAEYEPDSLSASYASSNLNSAILHLNIASDRIREYYAFTLTGKSFKKYAGRDREKNEYSRLFADAKDILFKKKHTDRESIQNADDAFNLAKKVQKHRQIRNKVVHEMASHYSIAQSHLLRTQQATFDGRHTDEIKDTYELSEKVSIIADWYNQLVKLGNFVFIIEVKSRT